MQRQLTTLEHKLDHILETLSARETCDWIERKEAIALIGVSDRHMTDLIARGVLGKDAVKNVGSVKRPRYRFHRTKLLSAYLNQKH